GYEPKECGKAGLVVLAGGKQEGKVFMIRGDMDALPIREEADVEFPSENGKMHACGHDMHTAMMLGAAKLLKAHEDEICGTVKLMFQPAEEIFEGSHDMIKNGLLKNPDVDAALMIHVMAGLPMPTGTVIVCGGGVSAPAADYFSIKIQGKGCHGSMPNNGIDPINVAAHIITALQEIHARELALSDEAVLTIGSIHGGDAANVIPDTVELCGTIRTYNEEVRSFLKTRMTEISQGIASSFRASAEVSFGSGCPTLVNDPDLSACTTKYVQELLGPSKAFNADQFSTMSGQSKTTGSEDFAYVSLEVPSIMLALAAGNPNQGFCYPQHHPKVKFDEAALSVGSAIYTYTAIRWLKEHS
ncbi:MAG: amidohydrolase, partial [Lachnospiraceae bacterium]|nr:amidohydrolase [Lachnospiraceae bacterium]